MTGDEAGKTFWDEVVATLPPVEGCGEDADFDIEQIDLSPQQGVHTVIDEVLSGPDTVIRGSTLQGPRATSVRDLTDAMRAANALQLPAQVGQRVAFIANVGSVLTYADIPEEGIKGTVVAVKVAGRVATDHEGRVFAQWDDGVFRAILAEHLRPVASKQASAYRMIIGNLGDLSQFFSASHSANELVHKATKDLWSLQQEGGKFVVTRLFDDTGKPLKV